MKTKAVLVMVMAGASLLVSYKAMATNFENKKERYELAEELERAKVSLGQGFVASKSEGQPISGKFEMEDGKLQLSVYTVKDSKFSEVVVDHKTGKVVKVEAITSVEDLAAAKLQSEAMSKAKLSLDAAAEQAVAANKGFIAISVIPSLKDGRPIANVSLTNDEGEAFKTVPVNID